jgi:hypothetical protein
MGIAIKVSAVVGAALLGPNAVTEVQKDRPYRRSDVDMPVSLSLGTVRTPEFSTTNESYLLMVQVERPKIWSAQQLRCMMGVTLGPLDSENCSSADPRLVAEWTVLDGRQIVAQGSSVARSGKAESFLAISWAKLEGSTSWR